MTGKGHETLEHTADMGIRGWGSSIEEAFEETAAAMFELIAETKGLEGSIKVEISCSGGELGELLVEFLNVLLMKADIEELALLRVKIDRMEKLASGWAIYATATGLSRSSVKDILLTEVKAATYYGTSVRENESGAWEAQCVVDL